MNILESIIAERRADVEKARQQISVDELRKKARGRTHHSLVRRLNESDRPHIIAEIKKASPSAGVLRQDYDPAEIAHGYAEAGASAISVLTEPRHFLGGEQDLREVRSAVNLPILRKDFLCDVYHVYETAAWGADVILLIVAALKKKLLRELYNEAVDCGLDVLVEAHTRAEVEAALDLDKAIIGVNSRDLKTLKTDLAVARELARAIPKGRLSIAESGIKTRKDIEELEVLGYRGFLIGEVLMKASDPASALRGLTTAGSKANRN
jgi:indole-3-glycerol phosphate synthase